ncbi:MAG: response regulator transcription factor [Eubacterium sp.]|nr:response regulator transcription factor [Eubacterium sp.]
MNRLLIVDDEIKIRTVIREYAEFHDYEVDEAEDGQAAVDMVKEKDYDIIVMDIMMPRLDGYSACKEIRKFKHTPIILLSARSEEYDKLFGFQLGIDDYVVKPFSPKELMARINAVVTRHKMIAAAAAAGAITAPAAEETSYDFGGLHIDTSARTVTVDGEKIEMTPKEYDLLCYLIKNKNQALSREQLLEDIWGYDFYGDDRTIDTHIKNLRNHLGPYREYIVTLRGVGYKFED